MQPVDTHLHDVPVPESIAREITSPQALAEWSGRPLTLTLGGHDLGQWIISSLRGEYDHRNGRPIYLVDLHKVEP